MKELCVFEEEEYIKLMNTLGIALEEEECEDKIHENYIDYDGIIEKIENKEIPYGCPNGNKDYQPFVDLTQFLLEMTDIRIKQGERRDNEVYWKAFTSNAFAMECMKLADSKLN